MARRILALLALAILMTAAAPPAAASAAFLGGFDYRMPVTITNVDGSTYTDIQALLTFDTAALVAAGKMNADCSDLRVTDMDGVTQLGFWIESGCNTGTTHVWVKVPVIGASSTATVFVYYGDASAASASSVANTFIPDSLRAVGGSCTDSTNCGYMDNHAEADFVRALPENRCRTYATGIDTVDICGVSGEQFFNRFRTLFVPDVTGTWSTRSCADDGVETALSPTDGVAGHSHTVWSSHYGGHSYSCGASAGRSLTAGQGVWIDFVWEEWTGGNHGRLDLARPSSSLVTATTTNFPGLFFARTYPTTELTASFSAEEMPGQVWYLEAADALVARQGSWTGTPDDVRVYANAERVWWANEPAAVAVTFPAGSVFTWTLNVVNTYTGSFVVGIGSGPSPTAPTLGSGASWSAVQSYSSTTGVLTGTTTLAADLTVPAGQYLGFSIQNDASSTNRLEVAVNDGTSYFGSPSTDPGYPTPEPATLLLVGVGMLAVVAVVARRK